MPEDDETTHEKQTAPSLVRDKWQYLYTSMHMLKDVSMYVKN